MSAGNDMTNLDDYTFKISKNDKVFIYWQGRQVRVLKEKNAQKFLDKLAGLDQQATKRALAKIAGNFKRGNER